MSAELICPINYIAQNGACYHTLWPYTTNYIVGTLVLMVVTVSAAMAGIAGGAAVLPILIMLFNYTPKDATIVIFCCILGTSFGNISNLLQNSVNGKPIVRYEFVFVSVPLMFTGAIIGVISNKLLPSIVVCCLLLVICVVTIKNGYRRFKTEYQKQNEQSLLDTVKNDQPQQKINPFRIQRCTYVFKHLLIITLLTMLFSFCRGSAKMPSVIGVQRCSVMFWGIIVGSFLFLAGYAYRNLAIMRMWLAPEQKQTEQVKQIDNPFEDHIKEMITKSMFAGILSGFGLGGGMILVPMYRNMNLTQVEAAATCSLGIVITSFINCMQGISIGVIQIHEFIYFGGLLSVSAFVFSRIIGRQIKKRNRMSYITGLFLILIVIGTINIPISYYNKYVESGYNSDILLGFGSIC